MNPRQRGVRLSRANGELSRNPVRSSQLRERVETKADECKPVGWILSPIEAPRNHNIAPTTIDKELHMWYNDNIRHSQVEVQQWNGEKSYMKTLKQIIV